MTIVVSAVTAVLAGLCLAAAGVLQQRAASRRPDDEKMSWRLLRELVSDRVWLLGIGLAAVSYGFQAVALTFGPLTLVQPLVVSELLFAVPVSVRLRGLRLRARDWTAVGSVVLGLTVGIVAANPRQGQPLQPITVWAPALGATVLLVAACLVFTRVAQGPARASAFALAGAFTMGLQSGLFDATITQLGKDPWHVPLAWQTYALVIASLVGMFLIQNAFQSGPLAASTPLIDAVLPLVAIALGVGLFGESIRTSTLGLLGAGAGILLLIAGIVGLDTSPVVRHEQQIEKREQQETARDESGSQRQD